MPTIDDVYGIEPPRASIRPEVVSSPPAVPIKADALARFREDPAALKASALEALNVKIAVLETQEQAAGLAEKLSQVRTIRKNIEARRKQMVEPLKREAKAVDEEAHRWDDPLEAWEDNAQRALSAFMRLDADRKRREEEARQTALRDAAQKQLQADAMQNTAAVEAASVEIARIETLAPALPVTGFKTEAGTISTRKVWRIEVTHPELVPPRYLIPDMSALHAAVKAGAKKIEGCHIWEEDDLTVRTRA